MASPVSPGQVDNLVAVAEQVAQAARTLRELLAHDIDSTPGPRLDHARHRLAEIAALTERTSSGVARLSVTVEEAITAWRTTVKYTAEGVAATAEHLRLLAEQRPDRAQATLVSELAEAVAALQVRPAATLAEAGLAWADLPDGLVADLSAWSEGDLERGRTGVRALVVLLDSARRHRSDAAVRALALTEAWLSHELTDSGSAVGVLERAVLRYPHAARLRAELAGLRLLRGQLPQAAEDAHRAMEIDTAEPAGFVQAGAAAETAGEFAEARELYDEAVRRLPGSALDGWDHGASFLQRTGLFHLVRARHLAAAGEASAALDAIERAIDRGVAGAAPYPDAEAHDVRWRLLQQRESEPAEVTRAAFEAGKRHLWNGDMDRAQEALRVAATSGAAPAEAGWFLAASLIASEDADVRLHEEAEQVWDTWLHEVGPPAPDSAWAYATRAWITDRLGTIRAGGSGAMAWEGIVFGEKALVLDDREITAWSTLSRCFRTLSLGALALEAVEAGWAVNPDDPHLLRERFAVLGDAGRTADALATMDRIPDADTDPWLSGVKALLLERLDKQEQAIPLLDLPLAGTWDRGWYLRVRAYCRVGLGLLDEAVRDMEAVLSDDSIVNWTGFRRAHQIEALCVLGRFSEARSELAQSQGDASLSSEVRSFYAMLLALGGEDVAQAEEHLAAFIAQCPNSFSVDDSIRTLGQVFVLMDHVGVDGSATRSTFLDRARGLAAASPPPERTAEDELAMVDREHGSSGARDRSTPWVAVRAVRARRLGRQSRWPDARRLYDELVGTAFDPEAGAARVAMLEADYSSAVAIGDPERARDLHVQLAEAGEPPSPSLDLTSAQALRAAGRHLEALDVLRGLETGPEAEKVETLVTSLLGDTALILGQWDVADAYLGRALLKAEEQQEASLAAQLAVRLAGVAAGRRDPEEVTNRLELATRLWSDAGAWNAGSVVQHELDGVIRALGPKADSDVVDLLESTRRSLHA